MDLIRSGVASKVVHKVMQEEEYVMDFKEKGKRNCKTVIQVGLSLLF